MNKIFLILLSLTYFFIFNLTHCLPVSASEISIKVDHENGIRTKQDRVTLRVKVVDEQNIPLSIQKERFIIKTTTDKKQEIEQELRVNDLNSTVRIIQPNESQSNPTPIKLIILLDMSGSMKRLDQNGVVKRDGAIAGIRSLLETIKKLDGIDISLALVPFGIASDKELRSDTGEKLKCKKEFQFPVNQKIITEKFQFNGVEQVENELQKLEKVPLNQMCAATNMYEAVDESIQYLANKYPLKKQKESALNQQLDEPILLSEKLSIILFSDGFDTIDSRFNYKNLSPKKRFEKLKPLIEKNPRITIHTLGYGESLLELRDQSNSIDPSQCNLPDSELNSLNAVENFQKNCSLWSNPDTKQKYIDWQRDEFIVDEPHLREIASLSNGISMFPETTDEIGEALDTFLTSLREYEISYTQPGGERGSKHKTVVIITLTDGTQVSSEELLIQLNNFLYAALSTKSRLIILGITIFLGLTWLISFRIWSRNLKRNIQQNLRGG